jgi:transposase
LKRRFPEVRLKKKCHKTVRRCTEWYRSGGLEEVLFRRHGGSGGREPRLSEEEQQVLIEKAREGKLRTIWDGVEWARSEADVEYSYRGMRHGFDRLEPKKKVSRQHPDGRRERTPPSKRHGKKGTERAS